MTEGDNKQLLEQEVLPDAKTDEEMMDETIEILADEVEGGQTVEKTLKERHEQYRKKIKHFILMNDPLSRVVFDDNPTLEFMIKVIMDIPDLVIVDRNIQADYKNLEGRSVVMDIVAKDGKGNIYNIEIQQKTEGAVPERARYHAGMIDSKELSENNDFTKLPNSFIIFITDKDETDLILSEDVIPAVKKADELDEASEANGGNQNVHRIVRVDEETGRIFNDRQTVIYINSRMPDDQTKLAKLMHDFHCENPDDMYCEQISSRVRAIKESPEEVERMCKEMDKVYNDGDKRRQVRVALNMLNDNATTDKIVLYSELSLEEVQRLQERKKKKDAAIAAQANEQTVQMA